MDLEKILSINGLPGLHKLKSTNSKGIFIEEIESGKVRFMANVGNRVVSLDNISIYTFSDSIPLSNIFESMKSFEENQEIISPTSSSEEIKTFFREILKDYDPDRVYVSDIKKVIKWYHYIKKLN
jgi:hypothetical protein